MGLYSVAAVMAMFPMEVAAAKLAEDAEPDAKAAYKEAVASDAAANSYGKTLIVTILGMDGETLLGPEPVDSRTAIGDFRVRLYAMTIQDYHPTEEHYPWQQGLRMEVSVMLNGEPISDEVQIGSLVGPEDDAQLCLDAALGEAEIEQVGPTMEEVVEKLETAMRGIPLLGLYVHGSWVRKHKKPDDVDLLAIYENPPQGTYVQEEITIESHSVDGAQSYPPYHVSCFTRSHWESLLREMDPTIILTLSLPPHLVFKDASSHFPQYGENWRDFRIDKSVLKRSFLASADGMASSDLRWSQKERFL